MIPNDETLDSLPESNPATPCELTGANHENPTVDYTLGGQPRCAHVSPPARHPRFLGDYELLEEIARGGMGVVFRARQVKLNRLVALKLVRDSNFAGSGELRRFRTEAEAVAQLDHPNIVPIYEVGQSNGQPYFSMKLIDGGNLAKHIDALKESPQKAVALMSKVARAVHYAHQRAILHRDIKPSNILLNTVGEPFVTDLGLAKRMDPSSALANDTMTGDVIGTPAYMPPEQARGKTRDMTTAADIYSLGATLYQTLTGRPPFEAASIPEILRKVVEDEPPRPRSLNPLLDRDLETICLKCLEKDPARRYPSAEALADDLDRWNEGRPIEARRASFRERVKKWVKRRPGWAALSAALFVSLVALLGSGVWFTLQLQSLLELANRGRYASDMNLARRLLDEGLIHQVREQLSIYDKPKELARLRGFEWYYLNQLCNPRLITIDNHDGDVAALAFPPDGRHLVTAGADRTVRITHLAGEEPPRVLHGHEAPIRCVDVSKNGALIASGDRAGVVRVWDASTGTSRPFSGQKLGIRSVMFSPDSRHVISADLSDHIIQWNVASGELEFELFHRHTESAVEQPGNRRGLLAKYTPDGKQIVSCGSDEWLVVWDVAARRPIRQMHTMSSILGFGISPDGRYAAFANQGPSVKILKLENLEEVVIGSRGDTTGKMDAIYSPNGKLLASVSQSGLIVFQDTATGQTVERFDDKAMNLNGIAFSSDGGLIGSILRGAVHVRRLSRRTDGRPVAEGLRPIRRMVLSADGGRMALADEDHRIVVLDSENGKILQTLDGHELSVFDIAFVPISGDARLISAGGDGLVKVWDTDTGALVFPPLSVHQSGVYSVAIRPDGRQFAAGAPDGSIQTWNLDDGQAETGPFFHAGAVKCLAYSPDGQSLASGGIDGSLMVWSPSNGSVKLGPLNHSTAVNCLAYSPDGRILACGGGQPERGGAIGIWDAYRGTNLRRIENPRGINALSFSPDSQRIATCGGDAVVQIWDVGGGQETLTLLGHAQRVTSVLFAREGLTLFSAGRDGRIKAWDGEENPVHPDPAQSPPSKSP